MNALETPKRSGRSNDRRVPNFPFQTPSDCRTGWEAYFGTWFHDLLVLDAGGGNRETGKRLSVGESDVFTQDVSHGLPVDLVCELSEIPDSSFAVVTAFDRLGRNADDGKFVEELLRISQAAFVLTTSNVAVKGDPVGKDVRGLTPQSLLELVATHPAIGRIDLLVSPHRDGADPIAVTTAEFLESMCPALGLIAWR